MDQDTEHSETESDREFERGVRKHFSFLESEYSYKVEGLLLLDSEYPKDARAVMRYIGCVGVEIQMSLGGIAVGLYELENGRIPEKVSFYGDEGYARAINLDSLVRTVTGGAVRSPLPELPYHISNAEMYRRVQKRSELIRTKMSEIIEAYADRLKRYGSEILKGDTSIFPTVQKNHSEFFERHTGSA
ncbi:MAG: hypothetical protein ACREDR_17390 [Blastocatellia bacterium]